MSPLPSQCSLEEWVRASAGIDETDLRRLLALGESCLRAKLAVQARAIFVLFVRFHPDCFVGHLYLGLAADLLGRRDAAAECHRTAGALLEALPVRTPQEEALLRELARASATKSFDPISREDVRRSAAAGAPELFTGLGGLASFPFSSLKHIARAATLTATDASVKHEIAELIEKRDAGALGRALDRYGAEGKLGAGWSPENFYRKESLRKIEGRASPRARVNVDVEHERVLATSFADSIRSVAHVDRRELSRDSLDAYGEALAILNELIELMPQVQGAGDETWRKLSSLIPLRRDVVSEIERCTMDRQDIELMKVPVLWRSLKRARLKKIA